MAEIYVHIGASRTGTTVLQKHILPKASRTLVLSKKPFQSAMMTGDHTIFIREIDKSLNNESATMLMNTQEGQYKVFHAISILSQVLAVDPKGLSSHPGFPILKKLIKLLSKNIKQEQTLISSERLCENGASLNCQSSHSQNNDKVFNIYPLIQASKSVGIYLKIIVCLRHPINYLRSKYLRTAIQRRSRNLRQLTPQEYIRKQIKLEEAFPGSSAMTAAMHSEFVSSLQQNSFVKAFGFEDLTRSEDVFSLLGINEDLKLSFDMFPKENCTTSSESSILEAEIYESIESTIKEAPDIYRKIGNTMLYR